MAARVTVPPPLAMAHEMVARALHPGARALDATVGNGHDTLFLAREVGPSGLVIGVDIQQQAIEATRQRLAAEGSSGRVRLFHEGHEHVAARLEAEGIDTLHAAMFNLGYLPGGDKRCITRAESTLPALAAVLSHLAVGGLLSVMLYRGHEGGAEESEAVLSWASALAREQARVYHFQSLQSPHAPSLLLVERRGTGEWRIANSE